MDWRDMPSLSGLRAFAVFAETGSLAQAGAELNVSHAAISQQLRAIENHMGVALLDRRGRALQLTQEGVALAQALKVGFGTIRASVQDLSTQHDNRPVHISCTPIFAANWLIPRLPAFRADHPEIDLVIDPAGEVVELRPGGVDIAIRHGVGKWPGLEAGMLLRSPMVVVASADLLHGRRVQGPQDLKDLPWLEEFGTNEASKWLADQGVEPGFAAGRVTLPGNLLMDALRAGQGVACSVHAFVAADLEAGRLIELFRTDNGGGYHIVHLPGVLRPAARAFVTWLRREKTRQNAPSAL